jgi:hypothetical protein
MMGRKLTPYAAQSIPNVPEFILKNNDIYGKLLKKSKVFGKFDERFVIINKEGLFLYKKLT